MQTITNIANSLRGGTHPKRSVEELATGEDSKEDSSQHSERSEWSSPHITAPLVIPLNPVPILPHRQNARRYAPHELSS
ncbi:hypothetical protein AB1Y20_023378 [Prymnesium parvum]|uniref:Uncharacterized protein n=1 Tax=Prymnesium parvum TaxID=97485 RepID=A0AB34JDV1_PRYPA